MIPISEDTIGKIIEEISNNRRTILKNQIDNAADVGIVGIILQFLSNFFSGKTAFKPNGKCHAGKSGSSGDQQPDGSAE